MYLEYVSIMEQDGELRLYMEDVLFEEEPFSAFLRSHGNNIIHDEKVLSVTPRDPS